MTKNPIIPILLAIATFALLALTLWPQEEPTAVVVVAARDLGAGSILTPADLKTVVLPLEQAPSDALADPTPLVGESLAVVRYVGEPVTPKHLGPAVVLAPDERGIAVRVEADTGLAGLLLGLRDRVGAGAAFCQVGVGRAAGALRAARLSGSAQSAGGLFQ